MSSVLLIAEADGEIGFGHLREIHALRLAFESRGVSTRSFVLAEAESISKSQLAVLVQSIDAKASIWSVRRSIDNQLLDAYGELRGRRAHGQFLPW